MKHILCHIARLQVESTRKKTGWAARHLESCQPCRKNLGEVESLEARLRSEPSPCDEALCDSIMTRIKAGAPVARQSPAAGFTWYPWLLGGTGLAAVLSFVFTINTATKPPEGLKNGAPAVTVTPPTAKENKSLAGMMQQQELLQRDARKLGAHLREHVILFQPGN